MDWPKIKSYCAHYLFGILANSFNGAITAVISFLGLAGGAAAGLSVKAMDLHQLAITFYSAAIIHALFYFQKHPIPEDFSDPQIIPTGPKETVSVQPANIISQPSTSLNVEPKT